MTGDDGDKNVLLVDDEALIRNNLADFLHDEGWTVFEAEDADHALAVLSDNPAIRVIVTDVQMRGSMDGLALAHHVRAHRPATMIIVASGAARIAGTELPADATFIAKPFDLRSLLAQISTYSV